MKVDVDQIWATPSTLHLRVIVWADDLRWRHKYLVSVPVELIAPEAVQMLVPEHKCHYLDDVALPGL